MSSESNPASAKPHAKAALHMGFGLICGFVFSVTLFLYELPQSTLKTTLYLAERKLGLISEVSGLSVLSGIDPALAPIKETTKCMDLSTEPAGLSLFSFPQPGPSPQSMPC